MKFTWMIGPKDAGRTIESFVRDQGLSRRQIKYLKLSETGGFFLDGQPVKVWQGLPRSGELSVVFPPEPAHPHIVAIPGGPDILYEDDHLLVINKPAHLLSNPSFRNPSESIANRVLYYYQSQAYPDQKIHLVTRLDRNTSGVLIFAKHSWAHALMDQVLRQQAMDKIYMALTPPSGHLLTDHGFLDFPIGRSDRSIIERVVRDDGKPSLTEYWRLAQSDRGDLFKFKLHTGRTHQIRVHLAHVGLPLLGDSLYGNDNQALIQRQALHCLSCSFIHPFTGQEIVAQAPLATDIKDVLEA